MPAIVLYLIKVIACSGVLMAYYWFALRDKQFHQYNRFYLLFAAAGSMLLPLIQIEWFVQSRNTTAVKLIQAMYTPGTHAYMPAAVNWWYILIAALIIVSLLMLLRQTVGMLKLKRLKQRYPHNRYSQEFLFIETDLPQAPFTFFDWLFWRSDLDTGTETGKQILLHEITHIQQKHTWDKLFMRITLCFYWMNPFFWLLQRELYMVHEFIADNKAVANKDAGAFAAMLLNSSLGKFPYPIAQPFFYSPIKRRLTMFTTSKQPRYSYARRMMALPVTGIIVLLFAVRVKAEQLQQLNKAAKTNTYAEQQDTTKKAGTAKAGKATFTAEPQQRKSVTIKVRSSGEKEATTTLNADTVTIESAPEKKVVLTGEVVMVKATGTSAKKTKTSPDPLYYIDDVLSTKADVEALNPVNIEAINVLKDSEATTRYGAAAANGVILIYTKK